jgi:hypothetical protein
MKIADGEGHVPISMTRPSSLSVDREELVAEPQRALAARTFALIDATLREHIDPTTD